LDKSFTQQTFKRPQIAFKTFLGADNANTCITFSP
jgi:hypothetical protein